MGTCRSKNNHIYAPKPYSVRPDRFKAYTTSSAVTVFLLACSVYVTESRITWERKVRDTMKATNEVTHVFEEYFQDTTRLLIDETRDTLHTSTASKTANSGFCYTYGDR